jgi:hypothetical protein
MGTSHVKSGDPCQDSGLCEVVEGPDGSDVLIAVACDGAGSAKLSQVGSAETCSFIIRRIKDLVTSGLQVVEITQEVAARVVLDAQEHLRATAERAGVTPRDLACTLVAGVVAPDAAAFFQVGDGVAIVGPRDEPYNEFSWVFWPERGEYANTTTFLSDDRVAERLQHAAVPYGIDEVAVLTDGIQNLVLDYKEHAAHAPFFSRMMAPLRARSESGHADGLSSALAAYLDSTPINERTDDDKTLILASRRSTGNE